MLGAQPSAGNSSCWHLQAFPPSSPPHVWCEPSDQQVTAPIAITILQSPPFFHTPRLPQRRPRTILISLASCLSPVPIDCPITITILHSHHFCHKPLPHPGRQDHSVLSHFSPVTRFQPVCKHCQLPATRNRLPFIQHFISSQSLHPGSCTEKKFSNNFIVDSFCTSGHLNIIITHRNFAHPHLVPKARENSNRCIATNWMVKVLKSFTAP